MKFRFSLPVVLAALVISVFCTSTQAQKLKQGDISYLKGLTKVYIGGNAGSKAIADHLQANTEGLVFVDSWKDADFSLYLTTATPVVDSFNSSSRLARTNAIVADIEGPMGKHPNEVNAGNVIGQSLSLTVTRPVGNDTFRVWSKSATSPVSRSNIPAYQPTVSTNLDSTLSGARLSLINDFLKAYKKIK